MDGMESTHAGLQKVREGRERLCGETQSLDFCEIFGTAGVAPTGGRSRLAIKYTCVRSQHGVQQHALSGMGGCKATECDPTHAIGCSRSAQHAWVELLGLATSLALTHLGIVLLQEMRHNALVPCEQILWQ